MDDATAHVSLITLLAEWCEQLELPRPNGYGITSADFPMIVANSRGSRMLTNPIVLTDSEINAILVQRL